MTWRDDVAGVLATRCGACHDETASGGYRVDSYAVAIGAGASGAPVAVAGDATSRLLGVIDEVRATPPHAGFADVHALLVTWVVDDRLAYERSQVHGGGIHDPASEEFHGRVLARSDWDFPLCQGCHGADFAGGPQAPSCLTCHAAGPTACTTCHGDSPTTGAHPTHVLGGPRLGRRYACSECHVQPAAWDDPGHLLDADGHAITTPAPVRFGALAETPSPTRDAPAAFTGERCENVYCHGATTKDGAAMDPAPRWTGGATATCTSCHGQPPVGHPVGACANCHAAVVGAGGALVGSPLHLDGKVTLGNGDGTCRACHTILGGAHASHLDGTHRLAAPIACATCHLVPAEVGSPGHFTADGLAAVFPPGGIGEIARADGASPSWSADTLRCAGTYCHGSGAALLADATIELVREPSWVPGSGAGRCGTCHGLPPLDGIHDPAWPITVCAECHPSSVDATGQILFSGGTSTHLNGVVDAP